MTYHHSSHLSNIKYYNNIKSMNISWKRNCSEWRKITTITGTANKMQWTGEIYDGHGKSTGEPCELYMTTAQGWLIFCSNIAFIICNTLLICLKWILKGIRYILVIYLLTANWSWYFVCKLKLSIPVQGHTTTKLTNKF